MQLNPNFIITKDGSHSLYVKEINETYHSIYGSLQESMHVFINNGIKSYSNKDIKILEVGFGTGLNTWLTLENHNNKIYYVALEPYPIKKEIYENLNFHKITKSENTNFLKLHNCKWERDIKIKTNFCFHKTKSKIEDFFTNTKFDIIYFDAFAPEKHPEIWSLKILRKCYNLLNDNGFLVTYCAKGIIKRRLKDIGFKLEILNGPIGKREMIRANQK